LLKAVNAYIQFLKYLKTKTTDLTFSCLHELKIILQQEKNLSFEVFTMYQHTAIVLVHAIIYYLGHPLRNIMYCERLRYIAVVTMKQINKKK
jgi:hypothetical protein